MADPEILVLGGPERDLYLAPADLERLDSFANWTWLPCEAGQVQPGHQAELSRRLASVQALVVYSGAPHIGPELMEQAPELRLIGELNGDRFAERIDVEAAWQRDIRVAPPMARPTLSLSGPWALFSYRCATPVIICAATWRKIAAKPATTPASCAANSPARPWD